MAELIKIVKSEVPYIWPSLILLWTVIRRFFLNVSMIALTVIIWIVESVGTVKSEIYLTKRLIKLECQHKAFTRDIKKALDQKSLEDL